MWLHRGPVENVVEGAKIAVDVANRDCRHALCSQLAGVGCKPKPQLSPWDPASAVLWSRILASRHDHDATRRVLVARTLGTAPEDRTEDASEKVAARLHLAAARQEFAFTVLHVTTS